MSEIYKLNNGRYIVASYDDRNHQYQSSNIRPGYSGMGQAYCYSYARNLEQLARIGIKTYATRAAARRALRRLEPEL